MKKEKLPQQPGHWFYGNFLEFEPDPLGFYQKLAKECGDLVQLNGPFGFKWYQAFHPDDVEYILVKGQNKFKKPPFFVKNLGYLAGKGLATSQGPLWKQQRRLLAPIFQRKNIEYFAALMVEEADKMCSSLLKESNGQEVNIANKFQHLTLRIASQSLFGADIEKDEVKFAKALEAVLTYISYRFSRPFYPPPLIPTQKNRQFNQNNKIIRQVVDRIIQERRSGNSARNDLLTTLMAVRDPETQESIPDQQIKDEIITLLLAGHDTTSAALTWTFYLLGKNPEIRAKACQKIHKVLKGRKPTLEDLPKLDYLTMIFKESLRLYPPAWGQPRQTLTDVHFGKYTIPKNSVIALTQFITHRHPDFWDDPERFDPERFTAEQEAKRHPFSYFPFGGGARICIGNQFALMEGTLILATILQRLNFELVKTEVVPDPTFTLKPKGGLEMKIFEYEYADER